MSHLVNFQLDSAKFWIKHALEFPPPGLADRGACNTTKWFFESLERALATLEEIK